MICEGESMGDIRSGNVLTYQTMSIKTRSRHLEVMTGSNLFKRYNFVKLGGF